MFAPPSGRRRGSLMRMFRRGLVVVGWALTLSALSATSRGGPPSGAVEPRWTEEQRRHWSFLPPRRPDVPSVDRAGWVRNPIDAFILGGLEASGIAPARETDRVTLIRRLHFDLT